MLRFSPNESYPGFRCSGEAPLTTFLIKMKHMLRASLPELLPAALANKYSAGHFQNYGFLLADYSYGNSVPPRNREILLANPLIQKSIALSIEEKAKLCNELMEICRICKEKCPISIDERYKISDENLSPASSSSSFSPR